MVNATRRALWNLRARAELCKSRGVGDLEVSRSAGRWLLGAIASATLACGSQLAHSQRRPATAPAAPSAATSVELPAAARAPRGGEIATASVAFGAAAEPAQKPAAPAGIEDPGGRALATFHAALRRAQAAQGQARIVVYGASHVASDLFTAPIRKRLQERFGEAGAGFVLPGKPWRWYRHAGIDIEHSRELRAYRVRARAPHDGIYGLAGVALDAGPDKPARAAFSTRGHGDSGGHASRLELYYLEQPNGGRLHLFVDGERVQRIRTKSERTAPGYFALELEDAPHRIELRTFGDGPVRVFGMALERDVPGVILDTLGVPGARARDQLHWDDAVFREHLARRRPDLIVLAYGTNESGDDDVPIEAYEERVGRVLQRMHEIAPAASCLLIGPSDRPVRNPDGTFSDRPRTLALAESQRKLARHHGCGFFDLQRFMGGPMSMLQWASADPPLGSKDHVHFTLLGYERLGEALHAELLANFELEVIEPPSPPSPAPDAVAATPPRADAVQIDQAAPVPAPEVPPAP